MNLVEKILARASGKTMVEAGEFVWATVDLVLANDVTGPMAIAELERSGYSGVFDPERIALVPDHFMPNCDIASAELARTLRQFARKHAITHYFEVGRMGIEHALLPEQGLVGPGQVIIGGDSHTCTYGALGAFASGVGSTDVAVAMASGRIWLKVPQTDRFCFFGQLNPWCSGKDLILHTIGQVGSDGCNYRAMEFCGPVVQRLSMDGRFTMCNMAVEAGAKTGLVAVDDTTRAYLAGRFPGVVRDDGLGASPHRQFEWNVSDLEPQVAFPPSPANVRAVRSATHINLDQVVIGSCTNGRLEDLQQAAAVLRGQRVHPYVRLIIIPATQRIYGQAMQEGLLEVFLEAGAVVSTPTCGPCLGAHMGVLANGERCLATTNRNFIGRMGHSQSEVYLANPAVAAASAVKGRIAHPEEVCA